ncbi:MAG: tryptophan--tRNA ligase [Pseudomonadota bacterium]
MSSQPTNRVFSGVQPSGQLHLGNYLGAIRNWVALQDGYECIYCLVDMHAITVWQEPAALKKATFEGAAALIAAGIDPETSILFNQSQVAAHAELAWIFSCVARIGWMDRMTQFKDKAGKNKQRASVGLYTYPALMAADILAYKGTHVPVGEDQKQHLELTRDIAEKFNHDYDADIFPITEPLIQEEGARIMSLRDGTAKMSKSDPSDLSRINLTDDADTIARKIRKARTDAEDLPSEPEGLEGRAEARNLVDIMAALNGTSQDVVLRDFGGKGFADFKQSLSDVAVAKLSPITEKMAALAEDETYLQTVLDNGAERAAAIAAPVIAEVKALTGFVTPRGA